jgi:signal transduction histidine kinase
VRLEWTLTPEAEQVMLPARVRLQLLRIVQESLDNALAHARGATMVSMSCTREAARMQCPHLRLSIRDDGQSSGAGRADFVCTGPGLARLEHQAAEIGAHLAMGPGPVGWRVEVVLPLD